MGWAMPKVLVVEDNLEVSALFAVALKDFAHYQVISAATGTEGISLLELHRPDLALVDLQLPGVQGIEVGERALALRVPIVLMTGDFSASLKLSEGRIPHLRKPFHITELLAAVDEQLRIAEEHHRTLHQSLRRLSANIQDAAKVYRESVEAGEESWRARETRRATQAKKPWLLRDDET
jgi:DNA-binding response OmpR family regulator